MSDPKIASSGEVAAICTLSAKRDYNRLLFSEDIANLDPNGVNLLYVLMIHEHAQGVAVGPHYRCRGLLKMQDERVPFECTIDVDIDQYDRLKTVSKAIKGSETK